MKNLEEFYKNYLAEAKKETIAAKDVDLDTVKVTPDGKKIVNADDVDLDKIRGKRAENNGTKGRWAVDEADPKDFKKLTREEEKALAKNNYKIYDRIMDEKDFMVIGQAGWAKTALITAIAKQCGRSVITVYLDKAVASDLGGIPVPTEHSSGHVQQTYAIPAWVFPMLENPDKEYLLFFDEMNQAQPDVMNALMPIILKHEICGIGFDNFIVGAAGNEMDENINGLTDINDNAALKARLAPMTWRSHDDDSWKSAFDYLHKEFDDKLGKEMVDKAYEMRNYLSSPRDIARWLFERITTKISKGRVPDPDQLKEDIMENMIWKEITETERTSRNFEKLINEWIDYIVDYAEKIVDNDGVPPAKSASDDSSNSRSSAKGMDQVNKNDKANIIHSLEKGYYMFSKADGGDGKKYLATLENIIGPKEEDGYIFSIEETGINREILERIVRDMEDSGKPVRFKTNKEGMGEAKKRGWEIAWAEPGALVQHNTSAPKDDEPAHRKYNKSND